MGLDELGYDALYDMAQDVDLPGRSNMSKEELAEALEAVDAANSAPAQEEEPPASNFYGLLPCRVCGAMNTVGTYVGAALEFSCGECGAQNGPYAVVQGN